MKFKIILHNQAKNDAKLAKEYYDDKGSGLGNKFYKSLNKKVKSLEINPYFQKRYKETRCLPMNDYPFMIHFIIDEGTKTVKILAILHTSRKLNSLYTIK